MCGDCEKLWKALQEQLLLCLAADILADEVDEAAFGSLAELIVAGSFLADHKPAAMVATVKPQGRRSRSAARAVKPHPSPEFDEGTALREVRRVFVFYAHQRRTLILSEYTDRTHRDLISGLGLSDLLPLSRCTDECNQQNGRKRYRKYEEGLFQCKFPKHQFAGLLWGIRTFLSIGIRARVCRPVVRAIVYAQQAQSGGTLRIMEVLHSTTFASPVGPLFLAASENGLVALEFDARSPGQQTIRPNPRDLRSESNAVRFERSDAKISAYARELQEYFAGDRREFSFPLDLRGTEFQLACWRALLAIPYGQTRTYADIARSVGRPQGFRAVGMANNRNPIAIVVPCHRVIASDGTLCGYGGGLDVKRKLLQLEGALSGTLAA